jgi:hypothetical protein
VLFTPVRRELLLRLLIADLGRRGGGDAPGDRHLREDVAKLLDRLEQSEANAQTLLHRRKYRRQPVTAGGSSGLGVDSTTLDLAAEARSRWPLRRGEVSFDRNMKGAAMQAFSRAL